MEHTRLPLGNFFDAYKNQPNGCNPQEGGTTWGIPQGLKPPVRFVIATVADPVRSHLSLYFDRSIDAIQQGAQRPDMFFPLRHALGIGNAMSRPPICRPN